MIDGVYVIHDELSELTRDSQFSARTVDVGLGGDLARVRQEGVLDDQLPHEVFDDHLKPLIVGVDFLSADEPRDVSVLGLHGDLELDLLVLDCALTLEFASKFVRIL